MKQIEIETIKDLLLTLVEAINDGSIVSNRKDYFEMISKSMEALNTPKG